MMRALLLEVALVATACSPGGIAPLDGGDSNAPGYRVTLLAPMAFTSGASPSARLAFAVSPALPHADVEAAISVTNSSTSTAVAGAFDWSVDAGAGGPALTFTPGTPLVDGSAYVVTVTQHGTPQSGSPWIPGSTVAFVVGHRLLIAAVDVVDKHAPKGTVTKVDVTFSEPIDATSATGHVSISDGNGQPLAADLYVSGSEVDVLFKQPPPTSTTLVLQVGPGLRASDGTALTPGPETFGATLANGGLSLTLRTSELTANGCGEDCWTWRAHL